MQLDVEQNNIKTQIRTKWMQRNYYATVTFYVFSQSGIKMPIPRIFPSAFSITSIEKPAITGAVLHMAYALDGATKKQGMKALSV